mmetsp:Transcript_11231/g.25521  ORF Transcript_11231/g.25521 Transcript_11231/m.25521 type:complete len:216 (+) Transcript_11231:224-871(+)
MTAARRHCAERPPRKAATMTQTARSSTARAVPASKPQPKRTSLARPISYRCKPRPRDRQTLTNQPPRLRQSQNQSLRCPLLWTPTPHRARRVTRWAPTRRRTTRTGGRRTRRTSDSSRSTSTGSRSRSLLSRTGLRAMTRLLCAVSLMWWMITGRWMTLVTRLWTRTRWRLTRWRARSWCSMSAEPCPSTQKWRGRPTPQGIMQGQWFRCGTTGT